VTIIELQLSGDTQPPINDDVCSFMGRVSGGHADLSCKRSLRLQEKFLGSGPVDAGVCDGDAVLESLKAVDQLLSAGVEMALQHDPGDRTVAVDTLLDYVTEDDRLAIVVLVAVGVRAVNYQSFRNAARAK
jgi:hypothetical protein